ncbi:MAG: nuclear transport factor 2 family protein, partial [Candidatus Zixiibacteriota bacterium]
IRIIGNGRKICTPGAFIPGVAFHFVTGKIKLDRSMMRMLEKLHEESGAFVLKRVNKRTVQKYRDGFRESDAEKVLSLFIDDVVWYMPGHFDLRGKEACEKEMRNDLFVGRPTIAIKRMVEEDD